MKKEDIFLYFKSNRVEIPQEVTWQGMKIRKIKNQPLTKLRLDQNIKNAFFSAMKILLGWFLVKKDFSFKSVKISEVEVV